MAFLKLRCDRAYSTGGLRTMLSHREFAAKMKRLGMPARIDGDCIHVQCGGATFTFGSWSQNGLEQTGWLSFTNDDPFLLSRKLADGGIRHRLEWSRPYDLETDDVRCVTSFDHRWLDPSLNSGSKAVDVATYDEPLAGATVPKVPASTI